MTCRGFATQQSYVGLPFRAVRKGRSFLYGHPNQKYYCLDPP